MGKDVSFVNPMDPVGSQIALQQLQRRQQIADALREQSLQPLHGGSVGGIAQVVSPVEGIAQLAKALAGRGLQKKIDRRTLEVGMQGANANRAAFGLPPLPTGQETIAPSGRNLGQKIGDLLTGRRNGGGGDQSPMPSAPAPLATQADPMPQAAPPVADTAPQPAPQQGGSYPMALSGNREKDYADYVRNPDEYTKAVIANHAPTETAKLYQQAADAAAQGNVGLATALYAQIAKNNYIAPINGRPGSTIRDPLHPEKVIGYDAPTQQGGIPVYDPQTGQFQGYKAAPGAAQIEGQMAGAKAGGVAAAQAPFDLVDVWDPVAGQMVKVPKSAITGGGAPGQGGGAGAGPITAALGGGGGHFGSAPPLGATGAADVYGKNSANAFTGLQDAARDVPQRISSLREMQSLLSSGLQTGPMQAKAQEIATKYGLPFGTTDKGFIFNKDAARYTAQLAGELGLNGSDARLGAVSHATPGMQIPNGALHEILPTYIGLEMAKGAKGVAAANWAQQHGPQSNPAFEAEWRKNYDPRMFTQMAKGAEAFRGNVSRLNQQTRNMYLQKYRALKAMGVDFTSMMQQ